MLLGRGILRAAPPAHCSRTAVRSLSALIGPRSIAAARLERSAKETPASGNNIKQRQPHKSRAFASASSMDMFMSQPNTQFSGAVQWNDSMLPVLFGLLAEETGYPKLTLLRRLHTEVALGRTARGQLLLSLRDYASREQIRSALRRLAGLYGGNSQKRVQGFPITWSWL